MTINSLNKKKHVFFYQSDTCHQRNYEVNR